MRTIPIRASLVPYAMAGFIALGYVQLTFADDCSGTCEKQITHDVLNFPDGSPKSMYDYGSKLEDDIEQCMQCAKNDINNIFGGSDNGGTSTSNSSGSGQDSSNTGYDGSASTDSSQ